MSGSRCHCGQGLVVRRAAEKEHDWVDMLLYVLEAVEEEAMTGGPPQMAREMALLTYGDQSMMLEAGVMVHGIAAGGKDLAKAGAHRGAFEDMLSHHGT